MKRSGRNRARVQANDEFVFRLYVAGNAPHSARALENLHTLCKRHIGDDYDIDIVDVLREPLRALNEGVFVTPTLVKVSPEPAQMLIGDLSEESTVLAAFGVSARKNV